MTQLESQIRLWILKSIFAAQGPLPDEALKTAIRGAFPRVAFTDGDLTQAIRACEDQKLIAGTNDPLLGPAWDLSIAGKIRAQQL
ncbi:MAG TPA: hypothetical protein VGY56_10635 [Verrucomicrobiae bacterium]|nr:hypothetical protein [Verrucomicrobiae bacterium]